jgi:hypothetical protein
MAKIRANVPPDRSKPKVKPFSGTCSNCGAKKTEVIKVKGAQVCTTTCLGGVTYTEPSVEQQLNVMQQLLS